MLILLMILSPNWSAMLHVTLVWNQIPTGANHAGESKVVPNTRTTSCKLPQLVPLAREHVTTVSQPMATKLFQRVLRTLNNLIQKWPTTNAQSAKLNVEPVRAKDWKIQIKGASTIMVRKETRKSASIARQLSISLLKMKRPVWQCAPPDTTSRESVVGVLLRILKSASHGTENASNVTCHALNAKSVTSRTTKPV